MTSIRETTRVRADRTIAIPTPALPPGQEVEVIVLARAGGPATEPASSGRRLKAEWGGALADLGRQYSSVELQHKAMEWWGD